jgi:hypothetical protein
VTERSEVVELLVGAGRAHHAAFADTDGEDPEWPIWYARHLREPIEEAFGVSLTVSEVVYLLVGIAHDHREQGGPWMEFYADRLIEALG